MEYNLFIDFQMTSHIAPRTGTDTAAVASMSYFIHVEVYVRSSPFNYKGTGPCLRHWAYHRLDFGVFSQTIWVEGRSSHVSGPCKKTSSIVKVRQTREVSLTMGRKEGRSSHPSTQARDATALTAGRHRTGATGKPSPLLFIVKYRNS